MTLTPGYVIISINNSNIGRITDMIKIRDMITYVGIVAILILLPSSAFIPQCFIIAYAIGVLLICIHLFT
jgi:hypothetical protein